jgi:protein-arginine kinase activator protein McsA
MSAVAQTERCDRCESRPATVTVLDVAGERAIVCSTCRKQTDLEVG